jgi:hypothetical protein
VSKDREEFEGVWQQAFEGASRFIGEFGFEFIRVMLQRGPTVFGGAAFSFLRVWESKAKHSRGSKLRSWRVRSPRFEKEDQGELF